MLCEIYKRVSVKTS